MSARNAAERAAVDELRGRGWPNARPTEVVEASDGFLVLVRTKPEGGQVAEVVVGLDLEVKAWKFLKQGV